MEKMNRFEVLQAVEDYIADAIKYRKQWGMNPKYKIRQVCEELSIFDWWNEELSLSQLKQMKKFLEKAGELGYNGYVCFKVGAKYCSHGMWAYKKESEDGYSPDGEVLFHSFRSGDNYWDAKLADGTWMHEKYEDKNCEFTLKEIEAELI